MDLPIALLALEGIVEVAVRRDAPDAPTRPLWFTLPAIAIAVLPLFARRRFPFATLTGYWLIAAAITFVDGRLMAFTTSIFVLGMVVSFLLGNLPDALKTRFGLAVVLAGAAIVVYNVPGSPASQFVFIPILFGICWFGGFALRQRGDQAEAAEARARDAEREREVAARVAAADERTRIARELHDIVAHAVSVMVLQVGSVRHQLPNALTEDREALEEVERTGRTALAEMRRLLGAMRRAGDGIDLAPQPGLGNLDGLMEQVGRAGLSVHLVVDGEPFPVPRGLDLSAYRIVQEGLTNALKHAHASRADVLVRYASDELQIEVRNDANGAPFENRGDSPGYGLVGVRERVKVYGGEMSAGRSDDGGFVLMTRLPLGRQRP